MSPTGNEANKVARARIFAKLKTALQDGPPAESRRANVEQRLATPPAHLLPARTKGSPDELRRMFRSYLEGQSATVIEVATSDAIPRTVGDYLRANNLALTVRAGTDAYLAVLPWTTEPALRRDAGAADGRDETGLSHATAGIAETGTLALLSGADNPVTLNYVPETHIVIVEASDLVGATEEVWPKVRARFGRGQMPRTVNFVSGPSRTADIAGTLVTGAHGPRRLCVIVVGS